MDYRYNLTHITGRDHDRYAVSVRYHVLISFNCVRLFGISERGTMKTKSVRWLAAEVSGRYPSLCGGAVVRGLWWSCEVRYRAGGAVVVRGILVPTRVYLYRYSLDGLRG